MKKMSNYIDVACNDPDNGNFAHVAMQIQIGCAEFESHAWASSGYRLVGPRFVETETGFRIAGKTFKTIASKDWYGNWCWNRYQLANDEELYRFVEWMHRRYLFSCLTAAEEFYEWFDCSEIVPKAKVMKMLRDLY